MGKKYKPISWNDKLENIAEMQKKYTDKNSWQFAGMQLAGIIIFCAICIIIVGNWLK